LNIFENNLTRRLRNVEEYIRNEFFIIKIALYILTFDFIDIIHRRGGEGVSNYFLVQFRFLGNKILKSSIF